MVLKADDQAEYADLLAEFIRQEQPKERSVFGVNYVVEQGDSFSFPRIYTEPAQSLADNFAAQGDVLKHYMPINLVFLVVYAFTQVRKIFCLHQV